jgi:hypothetical protein
MNCVPNRPWELFYRIAPILGTSVVGIDLNDNIRPDPKHEENKLKFQNIFEKSGLNAQCGMYDIADIFINVSVHPQYF